MIKQPIFHTARGAAIGSCANCGIIANCKATVKQNGESILLCGECHDKANTTERNNSFKELANSYGGSWPPPNF